MIYKSPTKIIIVGLLFLLVFLWKIVIRKLIFVFKFYINILKMFIKKFVGFFVVISFFIAFSFADLKVSPLKYQLEVKPWETITKTIKISNNSENVVTLYTSKEDFIAGWETWEPKFVEPQNNNSGFGLSKWININSSHLTLDKGETREVTFNITVPESGEPGWHYWAIFFSPGSWKGQVWIKSRLWVLILANIPWEVKIDWKLQSFELWKQIGNKINSKNSYDKLPISFFTKIKNDGNVHIRPEGKIILLDENWNQLKKVGKKSITSEAGVYLWEKLVDYIPINSKRWNVLPGQLRNFVSKWQWFGNQILREDGTRAVDFKSLQEHMNKKASENKQYLNFWETTKKVSVDKTYTAQMSLSYEWKNGEEKTYNKQKEFNVSYKKPKVVVNRYVVWGLSWILAVLLYNLLIWRRKQQERLKQKWMEEMKKKKE